MYIQGFCSAEDDVELSTEVHWNNVPIYTVLPGDRTRLRSVDRLSLGLEKGPFSEEEVKFSIDQHKLVGNGWSEIANCLPGRTENDVKIFWEACMEMEGKLKNEEDMNIVNIASSSSVNQPESSKGKEVVEVKESVTEIANKEVTTGGFNILEDNNAWAYDVEDYHVYLSLMYNPSTSSDSEVDEDWFKLWNFP